jgi:hypothetical protein
MHKLHLAISPRHPHVSPIYEGSSNSMTGTPKSSTRARQKAKLFVSQASTPASLRYSQKD